MSAIHAKSCATFLALPAVGLLLFLGLDYIDLPLADTGELTPPRSKDTRHRQPMIFPEPANLAHIFVSPQYREKLPPNFIFNNAEANVMFSISAYAGEGSVTYDGDDSWARPGMLVFGWKNEKTFFFEAHKGSVFRGERAIVYFADFSPGSATCKVKAFDLSTAKTLWETELTWAGCPERHSCYCHKATMDLSPDFVTIANQESYRDYIEVLDRRTGGVLAYKVYRTGDFR